MAVSSALILLYALVGSGIAYLLTKAARSLLATPPHLVVTPRYLFTASILLLVAFALATWVVGVRLAHWSWADLGWKPRRGFLREGGRGVMLGVGAAVLAVLLTLLVAGATIEFRPAWSEELQAAGPLALALLAAALVEELVFRGFPLWQATYSMGGARWPAILLLSGAFGAAHLWNDHATALGIVNIMLAGIWLSLAFLSAGGMALAWGVHFGWNFGLALLDTPVSGLALGLPLVAYHAGTHPWLDGGTFGPEGGVMGTVAVALGIAVVWSSRDGARSVPSSPPGPVAVPSSPPGPLSLRERGNEIRVSFPLSGTERGTGGEDRVGSGGEDRVGSGGEDRVGTGGEDPVGSEGEDGLGSGGGDP